ncbi:tRNA pseudouridine(55) synthase TruB [Virgibacillus kimchii]
MHGILPLWKPRGLTSHDCVMKVRTLFHTRKVGHTGTLDPEVEGVLPICIGQATKIVPFLTDTNKTYIATVKLGIATDTEDAHGKVTKEITITSPPTDKEIDFVLNSFKGRIKQLPPMYSAVKVNGKKLYEYAREGKTVDRPEREVNIHDIQRIPAEEREAVSFRFEVTCSKGTYVRTLCVDIGKKLGYPAHMEKLERIKTGSFTKKNSVTFATIEEAISEKRQQKLLFPIKKGVEHLARFHADERLKKKIYHGQKLKKPKGMEDGPLVMMDGEEVLAIYHIHPDDPEQIKPLRVFHE